MVITVADSGTKKGIIAAIVAADRKQAGTEPTARQSNRTITTTQDLLRSGAGRLCAHLEIMYSDITKIMLPTINETEQIINETAPATQDMIHDPTATEKQGVPTAKEGTDQAVPVPTVPGHRLPVPKRSSYHPDGPVGKYQGL